MLMPVAAFELRQRLKLVSSWVYFAIFFALSFLMMITAGGAFKSAHVITNVGGNVFANSPYGLSMMIGVLSSMGLIVVAAVMGQATYQDFEHQTWALLFTARLDRPSYLLGRYLGALVTLMVIFSSVGLGMAAGACMPFLEPSLIGRAGPLAYVMPYLVFVLPNFLIAGSLFFALAALTRKIFPVYIAAVLMLLLWMASSSLEPRLEWQKMASLLDPLGLRAGDYLTRYWTPAEKNAHSMPLAGTLLANRVLWAGLASAVFAFVAYRFRLGTEIDPARGPAAGGTMPAAPAPHQALPRVSPDASASQLALLPLLLRLNLRETLKNIYFPVLLLAGVLFMVMGSRSAGAMYGTLTWPVTGQTLEIVTGLFVLFEVLILTFYAGELMHRDRQARIDGILDALPVADWLSLVSKLVTLLALALVLLGVVALTGIGIQLSQGYTHLELSLYAKELLLVQFPRLAALAVLALVIQAVVDQRVLGYVIMALFFIGTMVATRMGVEHHLWLYGSGPRVQHSDMNGYGPFPPAIFAFDLVWALVAVLLALAARLLWVRGQADSFAGRLSLGRARLTPRLRLAILACGTLTVLSAGWVLWNTNVQNHFRSSRSEQDLQARYERKYKPLLQKLPQPTVVAVDLAFDVVPERRSWEARATYQLENRSQVAIPRIWVFVDADLTLRELKVSGTRAALTDGEFGMHAFDLPIALQPGEKVPLTFELAQHPQGFPNQFSAGDLRTVANGTFIDSMMLPSIGYAKAVELSDDDERKKRGLSEKVRMADLHDPAGRAHPYIAADRDWIDFHAIVSTSPDQVAIAPGERVREWSQGGRRYFEYRSPSKMLGFFSVISGRYQQLHDRWKDVELEIDYHPDHTWDLQRMDDGLKAALEYCTSNFSPFQLHQIRIAEFPRYASFAQSFAGAIPYSESIGFIARVKPQDPEDLDYPYYVTAHETAHQWWGHQVVGADVQGATVLSETLAQYTALMVLKRSVGDRRMRKFLRYELDRYLVGRAMERKQEQPLFRGENQSYVHYNKGSLAMYRLQDEIGEDKVNLALHRFVEKFRYAQAPFPTSEDLLAELRAVAPERAPLIAELFEQIVLYETQVKSARAHKLADGRWEVRLQVSARKLTADGQGRQAEAPIGELLEVGTVDVNGDPLEVIRRRVEAGEHELVFTVAQKPERAGVDPLNKLIDRNPDAHVAPVTIEG